MEDAIGNLQFLNRMAFCACCCERLVPNYLAFTIVEGRGDFGLLRSSLDSVWSAVLEPRVVLEWNWDKLSNLIKIAPDTDDFETIFADLAGDAVAATAYTIEGLLNPEVSVEKVTLVRQVVENSLFQYLNTVNDPEVSPHSDDSKFVKSVLTYPLMISELDRQRRDLAYLKGIDKFDFDIVENLRLSSASVGIRPIERGLVRMRF